MEPLLETKKAGPSEAESQCQQEPSRWQRQRRTWRNIATFALAMMLGWTIFVHFCGHWRDTGRSWRLDWGQSERNGSGEKKGSQYLLGVGKADITGYVFDCCILKLV